MEKEKGMAASWDERDTVLIADDDAEDRQTLRDVLETYNIEEAANGAECLKKFCEMETNICALLLKADLPDSCEKVLRQLKNKGVLENIPVFIITEDKGEKAVKRAYDMGAMDVILKPVRASHVVRRRVDSLIELYRSRWEMKNMIESQKQQLIAKELELIEVNNGTIEALATAIEFRSGESGQHVRRISGITRLLLRDTPLGKDLGGDLIEQIAMAAVMHDVGKIAIPDTILNKPTKLTEKEYETMKTHTVHGEEILKRIPQIRRGSMFCYACDIARHHHERWDGGGYPDGLKGDEIPIWTQVVSLADTYDALVSQRVYKKAYSFEKAVKMIAGGECGVFNPELLKHFIEAEEEVRKFYTQTAGR